MTDFDTLVINWRRAVVELAQAKDRELTLRNAVVQTGFPAGIVEGVNNRELGLGYVLKATGKLNYTLDNTKDASLVIAAAAMLPEHVAKGLFKWEADLRVGAYKKLDPTHKRIVDNVLTIKPGQPSLELVEPETAKAAPPSFHPVAPSQGWQSQ